MKKPAPRRAGRRRGKLVMRGTRSPKPPERRRQTARKANFCQDLQMNRLKIICNHIQKTSLKPEDDAGYDGSHTVAKSAAGPYEADLMIGHPNLGNFGANYKS